MQSVRKLKSELNRLLKEGIKAAKESDIFTVGDYALEIRERLFTLHSIYAERNTSKTHRKTKRSGGES